MRRTKVFDWHLACFLLLLLTFCQSGAIAKSKQPSSKATPDGADPANEQKRWAGAYGAKQYLSPPIRRDKEGNLIEGEPMQCPSPIWPIEGLPPTETKKLTDIERQAIKDVLEEAGIREPQSRFPLTGSQFARIVAVGAVVGDKLNKMPERSMHLAREQQNIQNQQNADTAAGCERQQASCAIDSCRAGLTNFTVDEGNKWNKIRNELFVPIAILLLLPGAIATQVKATVAQGFTIFGEVSPIEGIQRSLVAAFLIPASVLVINYGIDLSNSISYTIQSEYKRIFGTDMYEDAMGAEVSAFPVRDLQSEKNHTPQKAANMDSPVGKPAKTAAGKFNEKFQVRAFNPTTGEDVTPEDRAREQVPYVANAHRAGFNGMNAGLATTWNILCAFQQAYLYYLWFVGPIMAALWVWPMKQLRDAFPNWCEGVVTLCFWSLFWHTTILVMACLNGVEGETMLMTALNFLATACVKFAFDFAGLVKAAGQEAGKAAEKAMQGGGAGGKGAGNKGGQAGSGASHGGHAQAAKGDGSGSGSGSGAGDAAAGALAIAASEYSPSANSMFMGGNAGATINAGGKGICASPAGSGSGKAPSWLSGSSFGSDGAPAAVNMFDFSTDVPLTGSSGAAGAGSGSGSNVSDLVRLNSHMQGATIAGLLCRLTGASEGGSKIHAPSSFHAPEHGGANGGKNSASLDHALKVPKSDGLAGLAGGNGLSILNGALNGLVNIDGILIPLQLANKDVALPEQDKAVFSSLANRSSDFSASANTVNPATSGPPRDTADHDASARPHVAHHPANQHDHLGVAQPGATQIQPTASMQTYGRDSFNTASWQSSGQAVEVDARSLNQSDNVNQGSQVTNNRSSSYEVAAPSDYSQSSMARDSVFEDDDIYNSAMESESATLSASQIASGGGGTTAGDFVPSDPIPLMSAEEVHGRNSQPLMEGAESGVIGPGTTQKTQIDQLNRDTVSQAPPQGTHPQSEPRLVEPRSVDSRAPEKSPFVEGKIDGRAQVERPVIQTNPKNGDPAAQLGGPKQVNRQLGRMKAPGIPPAKPINQKDRIAAVTDRRLSANKATSPDREKKKSEHTDLQQQLMSINQFKRIHSNDPSPEELELFKKLGMTDEDA